MKIPFHIAARYAALIVAAAIVMAACSPGSSTTSTQISTVVFPGSTNGPVSTSAIPVTGSTQSPAMTGTVLSSTSIAPGATGTMPVSGTQVIPQGSATPAVSGTQVLPVGTTPPAATGTMVMPAGTTTPAVTAVLPSGTTTPAVPVTGGGNPVPSSTQATFPMDKVTFIRTMDKLWEDHVTWTRLYIIDFAAGLPDQDVAAQRLLKNQEDIGNAIKPFYGDAAGNQLTSLLKTHIQGAVDVLKAAKAGNTAQLKTASQAWYDNANQIAAFLSQANPTNWPLADMQNMMKMHLDLTTQEATARLKGDWTGDVAAYDQVHDEILKMSFMLSQGIIAQFPDKFK